MNHLVSIVIPCYRQGRLLTEAVESVFAQSYPACETIVVNDGSDDHTDEVARRYGERIRYVAQANAGLPAARNAGLAVARGEYVLFLDADDRLAPQAIERLVAAMEGRTDRVALCGWRTFEHNSDLEQTPTIPAVAESALPYLIHDNVAPAHCLLTPRALVDQVGGFETSLRSCEDWDLWLRLALAGAEFVSIPYVGALYRKYSGSMSTNHLRMLECRAEVLVRAHRSVASERRRLPELGPEILQAEQRVLRRFYALGHSPRHVRELQAAIRELGRLGYRPPRGWKKRLADALFGSWAERLTVEFFRRFEPETFQKYRTGHN